MLTSLRALAVTALLTAVATMFTGPTRAADFIDEPFPKVEALPRATSAVRRTRSDYSWAARGELIAGVRGATPLTVPFFGHGWYPGPVHYYGPPTKPCCRNGENAAISVMC
jgi:hypothetical protein